MHGFNLYVLELARGSWFRVKVKHVGSLVSHPFPLSFQTSVHISFTSHTCSSSPLLALHASWGETTMGGQKIFGARQNRLWHTLMDFWRAQTFSAFPKRICYARVLLAQHAPNPFGRTSKLVLAHAKSILVDFGIDVTSHCSASRK